MVCKLHVYMTLTWGMTLYAKIQLVICFDKLQWLGWVWIMTPYCCYKAEN